jgi:predicted Zn-dependent protease
MRPASALTRLLAAACAATASCAVVSEATGGNLPPDPATVASSLPESVGTSAPTGTIRSTLPDYPAAPLPSVGTVRSSLPDLGSTANSALSRADEYQIGRMMMRDLRSQNAVLDDPESADYLQTLGSRIAIEAQDGQQPVTMFVVRDGTLNAFALPGGFIGVNYGLVLMTSSESELAGVVAHEIGHVVQRHVARAVQAQAHTSLTTLATMLGAVIIGAVTGNANALPGIIAVGEGSAMQQQINFSRMEETEADRVGISYMAAAGFDPSAMAGVFSTMMRERGIAGDEIPIFLLDHPVDATRVAEARARVATLSAYPRRPDSASYAFIRERLRVVASTPTTDLRRYYEHQRAADPENRSLRYGAALAELKSGDPKIAVGLLRPLLQEQPELPLLHAALAQAQLAAGDAAGACNTFERALELAPRNVPLSVRYAQALMQINQAKKAHALLLDLFNNVAPTPEQIQLIALAANAAGDIGDAYSYMAELHIASGDLMLATAQLDLALATPGITEVQRKRFQARRDEIRGYLGEQRGGRRASRQEPEG